MSASFTRAVKRFEQAVRDHEMIGASPPEDHAHIQQHYEKTKQDLRRAFEMKGRRSV